MSAALIDGHDAALFDLDGVVYLGPDPVPEAPGTIAELRQRGIRSVSSPTMLLVPLR